jgi:hypothetical protein
MTVYSNTGFLLIVELYHNSKMFKENDCMILLNTWPN